MVEKAEVDFAEMRGRFRQGHGKLADMDDLRAADKFVEETKEDIMAQNCDPYPRVDVVEENSKVSYITKVIKLQ